MNPPEHTPEPGEVGQIVLLLLIVVIAGLWLGHHLGLGIVNPVVAGAAIAATIIGGVVKVGELVGLKLGEWIKPVLPVLRGRLARLATPGVLWTAGPALALLMGTFSSITVIPEAGDEAIAVSVKPLGCHGPSWRDSMAPGQPMARLGLLVTNPFGCLYRVEASGYSAAAVPVYPLAGQRVVLGEDLLPVPSVLFRPFVEGLSALGDGAVFRVSRVGPQGPELLVADSGRPGSFRLGRRQPPTEAMIEFWRLQLDAAAAPPAERARMLILWSTTRQLSPLRAPASGDSLIAEIVMHDSVVAHAGLTLGHERLVDVLVVDVRR